MQLDPIDQGVQAAGGVLQIQAQIPGEVVAGPGRDDQQGHIVLGGDAGDQGLGPVPAGHPQQIRPLGHRLAGQGGHIHRARPLQQDDGRPQGLGLVLETESDNLPAARARVHDQERPPGRRGRVFSQPLGDGLAAQGGPAGDHRQRQQPELERHIRDQPVTHEEGQQPQRHRHRQGDRQPPDRAPVGQRPPHRRRRDNQAGHRNHQQGQAEAHPGR
jgi:hypothetical protein